MRQRTDPDIFETIRNQAAQFDVPGDAVIGTTLEGEIVFWSRGATRLYGWAENEVLGRDILDITPSSQTAGDAAAIMDELRKGRTWSGDFLVRTRDGEEMRVHVRDLPIRDARGEFVGIVGVSVRLDD